MNVPLILASATGLVAAVCTLVAYLALTVVVNARPRWFYWLARLRINSMALAVLWPLTLYITFSALWILLVLAIETNG